MIPYRSTRYSILPRLISSTALPTSCVTVPLFGFGMSPRGPRTGPSWPTALIWSGFATATSKSMKPSSLMRAARSSEPTTSAPDSSASLAFSPSAKTATLRVLPVPFGSMSVPRTIWSARLGSTFRWTWASTLSSNFAPSRSFSSSRASRGVYRCSGSILDFCSSSFLPIDCNPHAPGRTLHDLRRTVYIRGVEVRHLCTRYLLDLGPAHRAYLHPVWLAAALVESGGLLQQERRRRCLGYESERAVLVDRDLDGDDLAHLVARGIVELPHDLADVHLRLAEGRSYRRSRVGLPACDLQLQLARYAAPASSSHENPLVCLELRYLVERELHGRLAPEDGDEHLQPRLVHVDIRDRTREVRERSPNNLDRLSDLVVHRCLDLLARLDLAGMQEPLHLGPAERERLLPGAHYLGDSRRLAHELPGRVVHVHIHEDVAGELALDRGDFLAVLDLDDALGRDADLTEVPLEAHGVDPALQRRAHLVLVTRVCIYDVPLLQNETLLIPNRKIYKKTRRTRLWNTTSTAATYSARTITMMSTTAVLCLSWSRSGQLTRLSSPRTSLANLLGPARKPPPLFCGCFLFDPADARFLPIVSSHGFASRSRAGGTRTPDLRFWRPLLYQLSYCPLSDDPYRVSRCAV